MLSILIPTYNYNVYPFAQSLEKQALELKIEFELICIDDGSHSILNKENEKINMLANSRFFSLKKNVGLSNNRNALAKASKYDYLLFIDGDSLIIHEDFLNKYISSINKTTEVIYGGRIHPKTVEPNRKLRWKYGTYREDSSAFKRNKNIYNSTLFNNTLIKRSVFNKIGFEKTITQYGHEDTVFSYNLFKLKAHVIHLENPILHGDVDLNFVYFNKTQKGLQNLNFIYKTGLIKPSFVTLLKVFDVLKAFKLNHFFALVYKIFHSSFKHNLTSKNPSLYIFELFKLSYFCHINIKK